MLRPMLTKAAMLSAIAKFPGSAILVVGGETVTGGVSLVPGWVEDGYYDMLFVTGPTGTTRARAIVFHRGTGDAMTKDSLITAITGFPDDAVVTVDEHTVEDVILVKNGWLIDGARFSTAEKVRERNRVKIKAAFQFRSMVEFSDGDVSLCAQ